MWRKKRKKYGRKRVVERSRKREEEEKGEGGVMIKRTDPI